jgi:hypothetical protein
VTKLLIAFPLALMLGGLAACRAPEPPLPSSPCPCEDDNNPCTSEACVDGACQRGWVTFGAACIGTPGFCDSDGACREECPEEPCFTATVEEGMGCVYEPTPSGWTCKDHGSVGVCRDQVCVPPTTPPTGASPETD